MQIVYKVTLYKGTEDEVSYRVVTDLINEEDVRAIIYNEDDYWVGTATFWLIHDRYDINVIEGDDELTYNIIEQLCEDIINNTEQVVD